MRGDITERRIDHVPLKAGIDHLPDAFREVARLANQAGLEGYRYLDAEVGIDIPVRREAIDHVGGAGLVERGEIFASRVVIRYEKEAG